MSIMVQRYKDRSFITSALSLVFNIKILRNASSLYLNFYSAISDFVKEKYPTEFVKTFIGQNWDYVCFLMAIHSRYEKKPLNNMPQISVQSRRQILKISVLRFLWEGVGRVQDSWDYIFYPLIIFPLVL